MKAFLVGLFWPVFLLLFRLSFEVKTRLTRKSLYVIVDLDNTIADTWPCLVNNKKGSLFAMHRNLPLIRPVWEEIQRRSKENDALLVFLSARPWPLYLVTRGWIRHKCDGLHELDYQLVLTRSPEEKLVYLRSLRSRGFNVELYDDMSYGHERGAVCYYDHILVEVKRLEVKHYGLDFINRCKDESA